MKPPESPAPPTQSAHPTQSPPAHMTPDEFRRRGAEVIEWIARYMEEVESLPVMARVQPNEIRARLPSHAPQQGESFDDVLRDLDSIIMPGITHWQSPRFFGYFPANASGPAILGELLSAGLGVQGMLWATSPACTELETHMMDWLVEMLELPEVFRSSSAGGGVIQDTASSAALCALVAARERARKDRAGQSADDTDKKGNSVSSALSASSADVSSRLTAYASNQAHSSIEKAMVIAGLRGGGRENLRLIDVDERFAMRPESLAQAIAADEAAGRVPCFIAATVGTTASNAIDPVRAIGAIARRCGAWLHVDAAMSGTAALCPEFRWIHDGLELADSYCFNPHKWMLTNFDCNCFWVADRAALVSALGILPEYLRNRGTESGAVIDYRDWQIPLGRRFRALKLWFVIRHYGVEGLQHHVRAHAKLAQEFAQWVRNDERFELAVDPPPLNLVCFRLRNGGDDANQRLLDRLNDSGRIFLTHAKLNDRFTLRLAIGGTWTERRHVEDAWRLIQEMA